MEDFQKATEDIVTKVRHIQEMSKRYNEALQVKFVNFNFPIFTITFLIRVKKVARFLELVFAISKC